MIRNVTKSAKNVIYLADVRCGAQTQRQWQRWVKHRHTHTQTVAHMHIHSLVWVARENGKSLLHCGTKYEQEVCLLLAEGRAMWYPIEIWLLFEMFVQKLEYFLFNILLNSSKIVCTYKVQY